jgi:hypothetical protein
MNKVDSDLYIELAELVQANVSGPMKKKRVASAQRRLIEKLEKNGTLSSEEADALCV